MIDDTEEYREELAERLPEEMQEKMEVGQERYGDAWLNAHFRYMYDRMEEEFYEFRQAVEHDEDVDKALKELADMVNFGLMYISLYESMRARQQDK